MQQKQQKRTRASHPKVRTGCNTCKARRVKCDEQRPACVKCLSTGRRCEGYKDTREWVVVVAPPPPVTDGFDNDRSRRHFDYFRTQAVYELSWFFDGSRWGPLVLKEAHTSAAVRHAVIALACSHEDFKDSLTVPERAPQFAFAAEHYSKAIRNLIKETSENAQECRMRALMCGLLFIAIEVLRGNNGAALHHLRACLKIVREAQEKMDIIPMFARLDVQAGLILGGTPQREMTPIVWDPSLHILIEDHPLSGFESITQACNSLLLLSNHLHRFMDAYSDLYRHQCIRPIPVEVLARQMSIYDQLTRWDYAIQPLWHSFSCQRDRDKLTLLRIYNRTGITLLESSLHVEERLLDTYHWAFQDMVSLISELRERRPYRDGDGDSDSDATVAAAAADSPPPPPPPPPPPTPPPAHERWTRPFFALDHCIIFSLYWTALKCRHGLLRRRAISLLELSLQEGIWSGPISAAIAKRVVEIEEGEPYTQHVSPGEAKEADDIPEYARVHSVRTDIDKLRHRAKLVILQRPNGDEGGWKERVEWVTW